jgi:hypothetical protein
MSKGKNRRRYVHKGDFLKEVFQKDSTEAIDFGYDGETEVQVVFSVFKNLHFGGRNEPCKRAAS